MELFYFWIGAFIFFLIIELVTATFYWLALSIASAVTAFYVWYFGADALDVTQGVIFALTAFIASYFLPRLLTPTSDHEAPQWIDLYIGQKRKLKKVGDSFKISLDGVDYLVEWDDIGAGDQVEVLRKKGAGFVVAKAKK